MIRVKRYLATALSRTRPVTATVAALLALSAHGAVAAEPLDFARDVRPILSDKCFQCHGPDEASRAADLRLDLPESATEDRGGYAAITPGDLDASEAIRRIGSEEDWEQMPPPEANKPLSAAEIETLRRWVAEGAEWSGHWAFTAPRRPEVPEVADAPAGWSESPIDAFVLRRLRSEGLEPSPRADRDTLLRRVFLDLTGLPPTLAEREEFLADPQPGAYGRLVDRLLASPHYGERQAQRWLDAARYADSDGYEKDKQRTNYFYRDWVIAAFNEDKPYDRFVIEQIAGDLMPGAGQDELIATGFLRNSMVNEEGGIDPEQFRVEGLFDRVDAIGKAVLGLTTGCAQCHSHKFDPISHEEYFGLFAYLNNCHEATIAVYTPAEKQKIDGIEHRIESLEADLRAELPAWREELAAWAAEQRGRQADWTPVKVERENFTGEKFEYLDDLSVLSQGFAGTQLTADMKCQPPAGAYTAVRVEFLTHPTLPRGGPGRSIYGTHALTEFRCFYTSPEGERRQLDVVSASADIDPPDQPMEPPFVNTQVEEDPRRLGSIGYAIDGDLNTGWHTNTRAYDRNRDHKAVFVLAEPIAVEPGGVLTFRLKQDHGGWNADDNQTNVAGRYRFSITGDDAPVADPLPRDVREIVGRSTDSWSTADWEKAFSYWRTTRSEWQATNDQIDRLVAEWPEGTNQYVVQQRDEPRVTRLLKRGDFLQPAGEVEPFTPAFLHEQEEGAEPTRLALAEWLVSRDSPTTARTLVNRVWQSYFGTGLVETPEDLGSQAPPPSHPELLDWLAVEFMDSGWRLKELHRLILTSATYQQTSRFGERLQEVDPNNRLLARASRLRVPAESVRDIALAASGLLQRDIGGEVIYPPAPEYLFLPPASYGPKPWHTTTGPEQYRRSLYIQKYRSTPYPPLQAFDAPTGASSCVRRVRSNTPVQALVVLNEEQFVDAARALAERLVGSSDDDAERLDLASLRTQSRPLRAGEREVLERYLVDVRTALTNGEADPAVIAGRDGATPELAAWTLVARAMLNLDATITRP
ncbi:PSD1 and planctomycete cytochrome C domain-containing protein [Botrimarina sp.]|uniref:PSD1 and planctomycete cytochrome C domain-containing protein n=1 Tax=Botrimarina sp. TaxID=2795802 RepID=UPI0032ED198D